MAGDLTIAENDAEALGVKLRQIAETIAHAVTEHKAGSWRASEGAPSEAVHVAGS